MKITRIEQQKNRPGRRNIYADGEFLIGVAAETLLRFGLRTGDEITPATFRLMERTEELLGAKSAALRLLSVRPRSEREIRDRLREKAFGEEEIVGTINDLKSTGLVDDEAFARTYIRNALALKPSGRVLLRRNLLLLGVRREVADEALDEVLAGVGQEENAVRAAEAFVKRASGRKRQDPRKLRQRLTAYLLRRGYTWDEVGPAVKRVLAESGPEDGEASESRR
ncbi:MAG: RecX family transcriptional regulator [Bacteroidota bacterium]